jgi:hypothetical protein
MGLDKDGLKGALDAAARKGRISCAAALATASRWGNTPAEAGTLLDEMGLRIEACQLGLFGYGPGKQKRILIPDHISADVAAWVTRCTEANGHATCAEIFVQAKAEGLSRALLAGACEKMELKIKACQLGAF